MSKPNGLLLKPRYEIENLKKKKEKENEKKDKKKSTKYTSS